MIPFAETLSIALAASEKTDEGVAEEAGIAKSALSYYRRGRRTPTVDMAHLLADALGVRIEWLVTGEGAMRGNAWSVGNRALFEIDGIARNWDTPTLGEDVQAIESAFYQGFKIQFGKHQYQSLSPTVHVIFGNLLARAMHSFQERGDERVSDPKWRGGIAGQLLLTCQEHAKVVHPRADFDGTPWSTRAWLAAMVREMKEWEGEGEIHDGFDEIMED